MTQEMLHRALFAARDEAYRAFQLKLIPGVLPERVIGVCTPALRAFAKTIASDPETESFLKMLPHSYFEEDNLHGMLISLFRDYDRTVAALNDFLPYVDNWATCDLIRPVSFPKNRDRLRAQTDRWIASGKTFVVRFGIEMRMTYFLDEDFDPCDLARIAAIRSGEYYVRMMAAWYFATALAKHWDDTLPYLKGQKLDAWTHGKTIQKAVESYRIPSEHKAILRDLRAGK